MKSSSILFVMAMLMLSTNDTPAQSWTREEIVERQEQQAFHWGQKGEIHSNNGWSSYGKLRLVLKGGQQLVLTQASGEMLATLSNRATGQVQLQALSIPKTVLLYQIKQKPMCTADRFESLGIEAETALFFLSQALPFGPTSVSESVARDISGPPSELRFLNAVLRIRAPWKVTVIVNAAQATDKPIAFEIKSGNRSMYSGEWYPPYGVATVDDSEKLENWHRCWYGATDNKGRPLDKERAERLRSSSTVGEIRSLR